MVDLDKTTLVSGINGLFETCVYRLLTELLLDVSNNVHYPLDVFIELVSLLETLERD